MSYTLENLKQDLDKKYVAVEIEVDGKTIVLRNLMRLNKTERFKVLDTIKASENLDTKTAEGIDGMTKNLKLALGVIAKEDGKLLTDAIGDDLGLLMEVWGLWQDATQPGEAGSSPA